MRSLKIIPAIFVLLMMVSCNNSEEQNFTVDEISGVIINENIENYEIYEVITNEIEAYKMLDVRDNILMLIDVATGQADVIYEFEENSWIHNFWRLENRYFVVFIEELNFNSQESIQGIGGVFVIFDYSHNLIKNLDYDFENVPQANLSLLKFYNNELFLYGRSWPEDWNNPITYLQRVNLHTGEVINLFEIDTNLQLYRFINDEGILVFEQTTDWNTGRVNARYGILNISDGSVELFERAGFARGDVDINNQKILIAERHVTVEVNNEVLLFNFEDLTTQYIGLDGRESLWARFSYCRENIVTINEEYSVLRKYNLLGELVAEVEIDLPTEVSGVDEIPDDELYWHEIGYSFDIFPITENIYAVHIYISFTDIGLFLSDHHIQVVTFE